MRISGIPRLLRAIGLCAATLIVAFSSASSAQELYKYRDEDGSWVYTDKKPKGVEDVEVQPLQKALPAPEVRLEQREDAGSLRLVAVNEYHCPVELAVLLLKNDNPHPEIDRQFRLVVAPVSETVVTEMPVAATDGDENLIARHLYVPGDPDAVHSPQGPYRVPFAIAASFRVSQAYPGSFSHTDVSSLYAIDIEMPVGTAIYAAREGIVVDTASRFFKSGTDFKQMGPRANIVRILHDDGTMAIYAHLNWDSIRVRPGQRVERGEYIADSGNTGFSTGPHLHFAIQKNTGLELASVPFDFEGEQGRSFYPKTGDTIIAH